MLPQLALLPPLGHKEAIGTLGHPIALKLEDQLGLGHSSGDGQTPAFVIQIPRCQLAKKEPSSLPIFEPSQENFRAERKRSQDKPSQAENS